MIFKKVFSSEFGKGAIILFVLFNIYNALNFLFHFIMGRMLGPEDYGTLVVLMSLVYLYSFPSHAIQNLLSKYTSKINPIKNASKIKYLLTKGLEKGIFWGFVAFLVLSLFSFLIGSFLRVNIWLIILTNLLVFSSLNVPIVRGILQGRKKFKELGLSHVFESMIKIIFAVSLVFLGMKIFGAILGVLIGTSSGLLFSLYFNKEILKKGKKEVHLKGVTLESTNYLLATGVIMLMFSLDILLAKRFFEPSLVGKYSVLSMIGKMIFFGTIAISKVMFPLTSEKNESKKNSYPLFKKTLILMAGICSISVFVCFIAPELLISLFYGKEYLDVAQYLVYSAIALSFLSLTNTTIYYGLSIDKMKKSYLLISFVILEIVLLSIFNDGLKEYLIALLVSNIIMFGGALCLLKYK